MSIIDWFKRLVGAERSEETDVSRTKNGGGGWSSMTSTKNLRKPSRDERFKPRERMRWGGFRSRPSVMNSKEAARHYSTSLATGDLTLRRTGTDPEQLERYGLPRWDDEADLAEFLGLTRERLAYFACHRREDSVNHYVSFRVPKRNGGTRVIMAPKRELRQLQRRLLRELVDRFPVSEYAHGFRRGRSIRTNAEPHCGKDLVIRFDLADFFGSVNYFRVRGYLVSLGYGHVVASSLALLMTACERQPVEVSGEVVHVPVAMRYCVQGAPTSPGVCNAVASTLDHRLAGLARKYGYDYTRYADDMTFSGDDDRGVGPLLGVVPEIVTDEGFALNRDKTRVMHSGQHQRVAGVTVNEVIGLSRRERRKIRAMIHRMKKEREAGTLSEEEVHRLEGKLAYVEMLNPQQGAALRRQWA